MSLLIFADNHNGHFPKHTRELISYGRRMAEDLNTQAIVLVTGALSDEEILLPGKYGAHRVLVADDPRFEVLDHKLYTALIEQVVSEEGVTHLLFSYSPAGKALAPSLLRVCRPDMSLPSRACRRIMILLLCGR